MKPPAGCFAPLNSRGTGPYPVGRRDKGARMHRGPPPGCHAWRKGWAWRGITAEGAKVTARTWRGIVNELHRETARAAQPARPYKRPPRRGRAQVPPAWRGPRATAWEPRIARVPTALALGELAAMSTTVDTPPGRHERAAITRPDPLDISAEGPGTDTWWTH
jgi:hypothetical protein